MTDIRTFVERYPVATYFVLAFAISWVGILILAGPGGISANSEPSEALVPLLYPAMLLGPGVAGVLLTGLVSGRAGLRDIFASLTRWRVGVRWYAVALLTTPLLVTVVLLGLSLTSPRFLPGILTTDNLLPVLLVGIVAGLMVGIFEEIGWTGFAVPRLRLRYGVLGTGIIVGLVWGAWHFPLFFWGSGTTSGAVPLVLFLAVLLFTWLPAFRVIMVWVYDRTGSLPVTVLMHTSLVASTLILPPLTLTGVALVAYDIVWAAVLWVVIAAVAVANGGHLSRQPFRRRVA
ncbi:MAG: CPBP family intramembrane glutamic endopeptidase [Rubrobacteraceae bacterium]